MSDERKPRVFAYCRASTKKQVESPDTQKEMATKYADFQNLGDVSFFVDAATSGKVSWQDRDAGKEMFRQLRAGDHVILTKLDRAFRKLSDCVTVLEKFERMGVKLHVANLMGGAIDLSSPMGRFMIHILAAFAELERAFISERTKDGLAKRVKTGVAHTRHPGYGFMWKRVMLDGKWVKVKLRDDEEREVMGSIAHWRMQVPPLGWEEITKHLRYGLGLKTREGKEWDENRVRRVCKAEFELQLKEQRVNR